LKHLTDLILTMQDKIDSLNARMDNSPIADSNGSKRTSKEINAADRNLPPTATSESRGRPAVGQEHLSLLEAASPPLPPFSGPTSTKFSLDIAKNLLQGVEGSAECVREVSEPAESQGVDDELVSKDTTAMRKGFAESLDLLRSIGEEEADRLAKVYEEILGALHPIVDFALLHDHIRFVFSALEENRAFDFGSTVGEAHFNVLILVLAIALLSEGEENRILAAKLFSSVRYALDYRIHANNIDISGQVVMLLAVCFLPTSLVSPSNRAEGIQGVYHFFRDEQRLASRIVAITARMTMEAGLHRREVLFRTFPNQKDREKAIIVLWSVFVFDRQFSFAAGLPDSMKDDIMDVPDVVSGRFVFSLFHVSHPT
jgi:hypothetical protein